MKDVMLVHSVVDILGLNAFLEDILVKSVAAFCGLLATPRAATHEAGRACIGMTTFGASAPLKELQRKFGFEPECLVTVAKEVLGRP